MSTTMKLARAAVLGFAALVAGTTEGSGPGRVAPVARAPAASRVAAVPKFDRAPIHARLRQMVAARTARLRTVRFSPSTELRLQLCQKQCDALAIALAQCVASNSDPVNPPAGSPLDAFNKLTNAQLAQKCPGSLQQCLDKVLEEHVAWCKATLCKSQTDAVAAQQSECNVLGQLLAQEKSQPPALKKTTPPCPALYDAYLKARQAVKDFHGSGLGSIGAFVTVLQNEQDALQRLKDNGCI